MKIFITGGTGFIGSYVIAQALRDGHEVIALRRSGSKPCIALGAEPRWLGKPMDQVEADDLSGVDVLVHLATVGSSPKVAPWDEMFYWNVTVLLRLLERAYAAGVRRIVIAGSFAEYGRSGDRYDFIPPDAPLLPTSGYAASKAAGFALSYAFALEHKMELFYLRIFSAFGEGQYEKNFWPALRDAALSGADFPMTWGEQIRDFIPVEQVAADILRCAGGERAGPSLQRVLNIASGKPVTLRNFAETWWTNWSATGKLLLGAVPYRPNEAMRFVPLVEPSQLMSYHGDRSS